MLGLVLGAWPLVSASCETAELCAAGFGGGGSACVARS